MIDESLRRDAIRIVPIVYVDVAEGQISNIFSGAEIKDDWDLSFESALACMRAGKICQCEIAPEFNFWMNAKKRIVAGEPTARLGPKANGHIVELCDDHFTARWRVAQ